MATKRTKSDAKMATKRTKSDAKVNANVVEDVEYKVGELIKRARLSGSSAKADTVRNGGRYAIKNASNGTSIVLRSLFLSAFPKAKEVNAETFGSALSALFSGKTPDVDNAVESGIKDYERQSGKTYGNFTTLRSRILSDIRMGSSRSFYLVEEPAR